MTFGEFQRTLEEWIPLATAWKGDNSGAQIGRKSSRITNILVALDVTMEVAEEAIRRRANLILTHHPLIFHPLRSLTPDSRAGEIALYVAEQKINLYAAHTNLDYVTGGVSTVMAAKLGLQNVKVLSPLRESVSKVIVFVPASHLESVARAMHDAGGGRFNKYQECSFRSEGVGTFKGMKGARPFIGKEGILERTREVKLEILVEKWNVTRVIGAMIKAHPYEEVAYDIIPLENESRETGLGAVGELPKAVPGRTFLKIVKQKLNVPFLRFAGNAAKSVRRVAVCGGAGSDLVTDAIRQKADAFITADIKYHSFQGAEREILFIDAGHFETEQGILPLLAERAQAIAGSYRSGSKVFITKKNTNSISYF